MDFQISGTHQQYDVTIRNTRNKPDLFAAVFEWVRKRIVYAVPGSTVEPQGLKIAIRKGRKSIFVGNWMKYVYIYIYIGDWGFTILDDYNGYYPRKDIYIYIYIPRTQLTTLFLKGPNPSKQGRNSNQNKDHLGSRYIYIYLYIHMYGCFQK